MSDIIINKEQSNIFTKPLVVCILALISCLLWGSAFPCVKIGYELFQIDTSNTFSVFLFAGLRFVLAGVLVIVFGSFIKRKPLVPQKSSWWRIIVLCLAQTVIQYAFFYIGLSNTTGVKSSIVEAMNVFIAIIISAFIFRHEKFTFTKALGCLIGFFGIVLINLDGFELSFSLMGEGFILFSTISYAFSASIIKYFSKTEDSFVLSGYQFFVGGIILALVGLIFGGRIEYVSPLALLMLLYLAIISSVAYTLWSILLKNNKTSSVSAYGFMNPVFGAILSAIFLREEMNVLFCVIALVLISVGILIINLLGDKKLRKNLDNTTKL